MSASTHGNAIPDTPKLIEQMVETDNMRRALKRVRRNKGAPGMDAMTVEQLPDYLKRHWPAIKERLVNGTYKPKPVKQVEIPKPNGGTRKLGVPTVLDRLIQQALLQVLTPVFDPDFSPHSYGFRPGRHAHQAINQAGTFIEQGNRWVVDLDLKQFFDEVNHDILMSRVAWKIKDRKILRLLRRYLQSGVMLDGCVTQPIKGTPQGGPISPLLSNILLDILDKELERRGHHFCRYADDFTIYVATRRAGERVMESITNFVEKRLRLKVNREKSAVDRPWKRTFLGYSFTPHKKPKKRIPAKTEKRFKIKLKQLFRKGRGRNLKRFIQETLNPVLIGWINYFKLDDTKRCVKELDQWIRRRLRCILWRQWKRPWRRFQNLMKYGIPEERAAQSAFNQRGAWFNSGASHLNQALPNKFFERMKLVSLSERLRSIRRSLNQGTAVYGTVRAVV